MKYHHPDYKRYRPRDIASASLDFARRRQSGKSGHNSYTSGTTSTDSHLDNTNRNARTSPNADCDLLFYLNNPRDPVAQPLPLSIPPSATPAFTHLHHVPLCGARLSLRHAGPSVRALSSTARVEATKKSVKGKGKPKAKAAPKVVAAKVDESLPLDEAIRVLRALEISSPHSAFQMEVMTKHNKPNAPPLRGRISLPHDPRPNAAREAGAHIIGGQDLFPKILSGEIVPTKCLATSGMMPLVSASLARFLGPKGLMPNFKRGTVGEGVELGRLVEEAGGSIEWKANKLGTVRTPVGRMTFTAEDVTQNVRLFMDHIRDQSVKLSSSESALTRVNKVGKLTRVCIETTHGPSIEIKDIL
ncbi:hypothetical protein CcaverHIS002_0203560 [Cutaneotrichosporon cavernicola]|nr:hypothetical protein CcaverHIS002_0203560 [Cutaneotrichosporon cavernicola]